MSIPKSYHYQMVSLGVCQNIYDKYFFQRPEFLLCLAKFQNKKLYREIEREKGRVRQRHIWRQRKSEEENANIS